MTSDTSTVFRTGVLGTGLMGKRMLDSLAAHPEFATLAAFDLDSHALESARKEFSFEASASVDELLARDDLDLVYVATPPRSHVELGKKVLDRGLALFLEKPLAADLHGAETLADWARPLANPVALNFPFASAGFWQLIERERAVAGPPLRVDISLHFSQWPRSWHHAGEWLAGDEEGGFLREVFSHFAYLTQRLLGPLEVKSSRLTRHAGRGESRVVADLEAGGVPVSLVGAVGGAAPDFNRWTMHCESRSYALEDWSRLSCSDAETGWRPLTPEDVKPSSQLDELSALLRGAPSSLPDLEEGLGVVRTVEKLLRGEHGT